MKLMLLAGLFLGVLNAYSLDKPKILYEEDGTLLTTTIRVVVMSGLTSDAPKKVGTANLLSEILLRGTRSKTRTQFQSAVERLGGSLGVSANHNTIVFTGKVIKENTTQFLKLLEECLHNPAFSNKEFRALKKEVLAQISFTKNNNSRLGGLALRREIFKGTILERPVRGSLSTVGRIRIKDLVNRYNESFHRGNLLFAIASPIKKATLAKQIHRIWSRFPKGDNGLKNLKRSIPSKKFNKPTLIVVDKKKTSTGAIIMAQDGFTAQDPRRFALGTANYSFGGGGMVSRIFKVVRGELGWTYSVWSSYHALGGLSYQKGLFAMGGTPSIEFTVKSIRKLMAMWNEYLVSGLKGQEIVLSRESLINSYPFEFESAESRLGRSVYSYLYGVPSLTPEQYAQKINAVKNPNIKSSLGELHRKQNWLISVVADKQVITTQLIKEQQGVPKAQQLTISRVISPEEIIQ